MLTVPKGSFKNSKGRNLLSGRAFQSYDSIIAFEDINGNVYLDEKFWKYSPTTSKYRNMFLRETTKETENRVKMGEYQLTNLNL